MIRSLTVCPSTLEEGHETYSKKALNLLFDGKKVSHIFNAPGIIAESEETQMAISGVGRISMSGVQPKFAVIVDEKDAVLRYTKDHEQSTFILKPRPNSYHILNKDYCVANEHLTMQLASQIYGIETAINAICFYADGEPAYITRRFDVYSQGKYHQEDFASLMGYTKVHGGSDYKYCNASYEECAEVIHKYVKASAIDKVRFFRVVLFNFITLNDDAHLKNFSLINRGEEYRLSPAYDLINTSLHLARPRIFALEKGLFKEGMNLSDTRQISRMDFEEFGRRIGLPLRIIQKELDVFAKECQGVKRLIDNSFLSSELKEQYYLSMNYRRKLLIKD